MRPRSFAIVVGLALAGPAANAQSPAAPATGTGLESTRSTVSKWIATQDLIFREKKEWQEGRELIEARVQAMQQEISAVETGLAGSEQILEELRRKRTDTATTETRLHDGSTHLAEIVTMLEADVLRLHKLLPPAVQQKVDPLHRRIPDDPRTTRISVGERFQNVVGILNEIHKANGEISLVTEIRALSDGKPSEVKTVYVGLGQAYFVSAGGEAGVGRPTADGWDWRAANDLAEDVSEVIEILENKGKPKFVGLPVIIE